MDAAADPPTDTVTDTPTDSSVRAAVVDDIGDIRDVGGSVWHLPHADDPLGQLDANLVRLGSLGGVDDHVVDDVDVLIVVREGAGRVEVAGEVHGVHPSSILLVPRGVRRSVAAGPSGLAYLTVHLRRGPLTIGPPGGSDHDDG